MRVKENSKKNNETELIKNKIVFEKCIAEGGGSSITKIQQDF